MGLMAQVRQLAAALDVPQVIIDKPPSADLWADQTDEDELGFTYEDVDKLLYLLVDQRNSPEECVAAGFAEKFVRTVVDRVRRYHFKRVMPPIAKVGSHTVGDDFLYLRHGLNDQGLSQRKSDRQRSRISWGEGIIQVREQDGKGNPQG